MTKKKTKNKLDWYDDYKVCSCCGKPLSRENRIKKMKMLKRFILMASITRILMLILVPPFFMMLRYLSGGIIEFSANFDIIGKFMIFLICGALLYAFLFGLFIVFMERPNFNSKDKRERKLAIKMHYLSLSVLLCTFCLGIYLILIGTILEGILCIFWSAGVSYIQIRDYRRAARQTERSALKKIFKFNRYKQAMEKIYVKRYSIPHLCLGFMILFLVFAVLCQTLIFGTVQQSMYPGGNVSFTDIVSEAFNFTLWKHLALSLPVYVFNTFKSLPAWRLSVFVAVMLITIVFLLNTPWMGVKTENERKIMELIYYYPWKKRYFLAMKMIKFCDKSQAYKIINRLKSYGLVSINEDDCVFLTEWGKSYITKITSGKN